MAEIYLNDIAHGRSGDKGDTSNVCVFARKPEYYAIIEREVTPERLKEYFGDMVKGEITRYPVPSLGGFNFVMKHAALMEMIRQKEYSLLLTDLNMPDINGFELLELLRSSNVGNSPTIPVVVATASGSCNKGELLAKGFAGCLFKPFSISELMEVSDRCAIKATPDGKPDFSALLSYGNEAVMLEKLITETEKEMQAVRDAAKEKDLQKLDSLIHHLRSSWEVLRADQPLNVLYGLLRGDALPDGEALSHAVTAVLDKGVEIIRLAEEERRKYEDE